MPHMGLDQSAGGGPNPDTAEQKREVDVLYHLSVTVAADLIGIEHRAKPLVEDDDVGGFDGDVGLV